LIQRKLANALLFNAYDCLLTREEHQINIPSLCKLIGYNSKDYALIKKALVGLISTVVEWNLVDKHKNGEEGGVWNASSIIADASIEGSVCTYSYSRKMRELLYRPEIYGCLNMYVQAKFKSSYGLALYENCIRYQNISKTPWFKMAIFRKLMGVDPGKYSTFRDFNKRVLKIGISEVNAYSPIFIEVNLRKENGKVTALQFLITKSNSFSVKGNQSIDNFSTSPTLSTRLKNDYALNDMQIANILTAYTEAYILEKMTIIEASSSYQNGKIANLARYLEKALKENYQAPRSSKQAIDSKINQEAKKLSSTEKLALREYQYWQDSQIIELFNSLSEQEKGSVTNLFLRSIKNSVYEDVFLSSKLENPLVSVKFCEFIRYQYKDWLEKILSFEEYMKLEKGAVLISA